MDFIAFGLDRDALFVCGASAAARHTGTRIYRAPGHPWTTAFFVAACAGIVVQHRPTDPANSASGWGIMLTGIPVYLYLEPPFEEPRHDDR